MFSSLYKSGLETRKYPELINFQMNGELFGVIHWYSGTFNLVFFTTLMCARKNNLFTQEMRPFTQKVIPNFTNCSYSENEKTQFLSIKN